MTSLMVCIPYQNLFWWSHKLGWNWRAVGPRRGPCRSSTHNQTPHYCPLM